MDCICCQKQSFGLDECLEKESLWAWKTVFISSHQGQDRTQSMQDSWWSEPYKHPRNGKFLIWGRLRVWGAVLVERGEKVQSRKAGEYLSRPDLA